MSSTTEPVPPISRSEPRRRATPTGAGLNIQHYGTSADATRVFLNRIPKIRPPDMPEQQQRSPGSSDKLPDDAPF
jgi:hypothetical protein